MSNEEIELLIGVAEDSIKRARAKIRSREKEIENLMSEIRDLKRDIKIYDSHIKDLDKKLHQKGEN